MTPSTATVTLLFTDLVNSTELLDRLGDDAAEQVRRAHFRLLRDAVATCGGEEVKNLGDGLMVAFASAVDAVGCAVAMQQAVHRYNHRQGTHDLQVRVGLHVGEPIRDEDDYFGTPVVVAKRLCDRAQGGQILLSDLVRGLVGARGNFTFRDAGAFSLKGLGKPVAAYEVMWESAPAQPLPLPAALAAGERTPFVGRTRELALLDAAWQHARNGQRQLVLVAGEPGIGKTRLTTEFALTAHREQASVLYGRCYEEALASFQPFLEALRQYVNAAALDELRAVTANGGGELTRLVPELAQRLPHLPPPVSGDPDGERYRLFEAVVALLTNASQNKPLVLLLDDLHWADKPTLLLLKHIVRTSGAGASPAHLMILGTYRENELARTHPLSETLADLRRERLFERVALKGLDESDTGALISALAGHTAPSEFVRRVYADTEGNPFFTEEVLRHLAEAGVIYQRDGRWTTDRNIEELGIPEGVREVIGRRLSRLSEECNRILSVAAVIGREFDLDVLEKVVDTSSDRLPDVLEEAVSVRLLQEIPTAPSTRLRAGIGAYSFSHALIRETLYAELTAARRLRLHRRIGEALERIHIDAHLSALAHHFLEAAPGGDIDKAIDYAVRAAEHATRQLAFEEAAQHYQRALQALELKDPIDERRQCDLLLGLGEAHNRGGELEPGKMALRTAADIARRLGLVESLGRAAMLFGGMVYGAQSEIDQERLDLVEEALRELPPADSILRAQLLARLALARLWLDVPEKSRAWSQEALDMARRLGDPPTLALTTYAHQMAGWGPDEPPAEQQAAWNEVISLALKAEDNELALNAWFWSVGTFFEGGDIAGADHAIDAFEQLVAKLRHPVYLQMREVFRATRLLLDGRFEQAAPLIYATVQAGQQGAMRAPGELAGSQLALLLAEQGNLLGWEEAVRDFMRRSLNPDAAWCMLAWGLSESGQEAEARREWEALAAQDFEDLRRDVLWLCSISLLSEVAAFLHDTRRAEMLYRLLLPYADRHVVRATATCYGAASRYLGLLATTMSRWDSAAQHFEHALEMDARMGARPWVAHTQYDYAHMLLARNAGGDREKALDLLERAVTTAQELGMKALDERASALKGSAAEGP